MSRLDKLLGKKRETLSDVIKDVQNGQLRETNLGWIRREKDYERYSRRRVTHKHVYVELRDFFREKGIQVIILDENELPIIENSDGFLSKPVNQYSRIILRKFKVPN